MKSIHHSSLFGLFVVLMLCTAVNLFAQDATLRGVVYDSETMKPIPQVNIFLRGTTRGATADVEGRFALQVPGGKDYIVAFSHAGYKKNAYKVEIVPGGEYDTDIILEPSSVTSEEEADFIQRRFPEARAQYVITEAQIESFTAHNLQDLFEQYMPQVLTPAGAFPSYQKSSGIILFVDNFIYDQFYMNTINPYEIKKIVVWQGGWRPNQIGRQTNHYVHVITK